MFESTIWKKNSNSTLELSHTPLIPKCKELGNVLINPNFHFMYIITNYYQLVTDEVLSFLKTIKLLLNNK
jgi:hypothetical protein